MDAESLPLARGAPVVELTELASTSMPSPGRRRLRQAPGGAQSLSPRFPSTFSYGGLSQEGPSEPLEADARTTTLSPSAMINLTPGSMLRRVSSYQVPTTLDPMTLADPRIQSHHGRKHHHHLYGDHDETAALLRAESLKYRERQRQRERDSLRSTPTLGARLQTYVLTVLVNLTSGIIAFLLSSTLAVSCASVIVGHGTPLAAYIAHFIDMNFLGTAILSVVLAWQSHAPWTLGAIDVFVVPVMSTMAQRITFHLDADMDRAVPTTIVMVALVSFILGAVFFVMGLLRVTSIANYMPYPVIAGFLSGIGAELIRNGAHLAAEQILSGAFFTWDQQALLFPAVAFAALARLAQFLRWPVAISFPCLLLLSLAGFHVLASQVFDQRLEDLEAQGWIFPWPADVVRATPMWYPWREIDFGLVDWGLITHECFGYLVSLIILGALKYSVATTSLSTLFAREISPDHEMWVIGLANMTSGLLGGCGGCHYLSAMGIMKQFEAHEKVPALVCAGLLLWLWVEGIRVLQLVPKFVFGGLIISVGVHFLEAYFVAPFGFLKPLEKAIVVLITVSFLIVGMLEAVGLGVIISMIDLIYRIHAVGCIHHETTGRLTRSSVDRSPEQVAFLDDHGHAIFILRLQGYLFFGTSVNILERIETRVRSTEFERLAFVIIDFGLVPDFDATALLNFRKATHLAERFGFDLYFCGLKASIEAALRRNAPVVSERVHYLTGNVDSTLELCENQLLPATLCPPMRGPLAAWTQATQLTLWEQFIKLHEHEGVPAPKLLPLAAYLDKEIVPQGSHLCRKGIVSDTFFVCYGFLNVLIDAESALDNLPGIHLDRARSASSRSGGVASSSTMSRLRLTETSQWTPFSTGKERLRKIGPGSIITPDMTHGTGGAHQYIATADCVLLRLSPGAMDRVESQAPFTAVAVLKLINGQVSARFLYANKRVTQLSSLLYK